jgi:hypothetical protein
MAEIVSQYRIEVKQAVDALNQVADTTETTEKNLKKTGDTGKKAGADIKAAANQAEKGLNAINPTLGRVVSGFRAMVGGIQAVVTAMRTLKIAIAATGIGLIILAIGAITAAATRLQPVMDRLGVVFAQVGQVVNVLVDRLAHFGAGLLDIATGNFAAGFNRIKESLSGIGDEMSREIELAGILKRQLQEMEKARLINSATVAKLRADIDALNATYQDETVSIQDQIKAQQEILKLRGLISDALTRETKEMIANALGQAEVTAETDKFIDTLRSQENLLLSTSEKAAKASELIKQLGLDESTVKDLEQAVELVNRYTAAEQERVQGVRRVNSAILSLNNQIKGSGQEVERIAATTIPAFGNATVMVGESISSVRDQLNRMKKAKEEAFEFSDEFRKADAEIQRLEKRLEEFGDTVLKVGADVRTNVVEDAMLAAQKMQETQQQALDVMQAGLSTLSNIYASVAQMAEQTTRYELQLLRDRFEDGEITREEYYAKEKQLQRESAQRAKDAATFQAILGAAQAALNALSTPGVPFPIALAFSLFAAAQAAVQVAAIQSAPIPRFEQGGAIKGKRHYQGGEFIEAEAGEYVVNRKATAKNYELIEAINKGMGEAYIMRKWVAPAVDAALLNGWQDVGKSAELNGLTATLKDHNIIRAMDRNREATTYGLTMVAGELKRLKSDNSRKAW